MDQWFSDVFARHGSEASPQGREELTRALSEACRNLAETLVACSPTLRQDLLAAIARRIRAFLDETDAQAARSATEKPPPNGPAPGGSPFPPPTDVFPIVKLPPELLEQARQRINEEEIVAGIREIEETGGLELRDFLHELEKAAGLDE